MPSQQFNRLIDRKVDRVAVPLEMRLKIRLRCGGEKVLFNIHLRLAETIFDLLPSGAVLGMGEVVLPSLADQLHLRVALWNG